MDEMSSDKEKILRSLKFVVKLKCLLSGRSKLEVVQELKLIIEKMNSQNVVLRSDHMIVIKLKVLLE